MIVIADSNKATVTFHDDGHLMQIDKKCALMRISLDAWSDLESAKKALTTREVKWDKWTPQVMCEPSYYHPDMSLDAAARDRPSFGEQRHHPSMKSLIWSTILLTASRAAALARGRI